jgi:tetratricopeptide (TPR) repeat protein
VAKLAIIPGLRVLASSPERLPEPAHNVPITALEPDDAARLFRQEWPDGGAASQLVDNQELRDFLETDLDGHPLAIILAAAQGNYYESLTALRQNWQDNSLQPDGILPSRNYPRSLENSMSLSLKVAIREMPEAVLLWSILGLFPQGLEMTASKEIVQSQPDKEMLKLLIRLNIARSAGSGVLKVLAPVRQFILAQVQTSLPGISATPTAGSNPLVSLRHFFQTRGKKEDAEFNEDMLFRLVYQYYLKMAKNLVNINNNSDAYAKNLDNLLEDFPNLHYFSLYAATRGDKWLKELAVLNQHLLPTYQWRIPTGHNILKTIIDLQQQYNNDFGLAKAYRSLGDLEEMMGRADEALDCYRRAINLYQQKHANYGLANAYLGLGSLDERHNRVENALENYRQAVELYKREHNAQDLANAYRILGDLEGKHGLVEDAHEHYRQAIKLYQSKRDNLGLANCHKSLGDLKQRLGQVDEALQHYQQAIELFKKQRHNPGLASTNQGLGDLEMSRNNIDEARKFYLEARDLFVSEQDSSGEACACSALARAASALGDPESSAIYMEEAIRAAKQCDQPGMIEQMESAANQLELANGNGH